MPSEIRRLMFFHSELFDALKAYGAKNGNDFVGDKIIRAKFASQESQDFHTQKEFRTNTNEDRNTIVVTFFDNVTFEHHYHNLSSEFVTNALVEYSATHNIPLPENSRKSIDATEFNICLDIIINDKDISEIKLSLEDD